MYRTRYIAPAAQPEPKPLAELSRVQLAARIHQLREALDALWTQSEVDVGEPYACIGRLQLEQAYLHAKLHQLDRQTGQPFAAAVTIPAAERRLRQAGADLSECIRAIALDGARAMARAAEREHHALLRAVEVVPPEELLGLAPSLARELSMQRIEA